MKFYCEFKVKLPMDLAEEVDQICRLHKISRAFLIRSLLRTFIDELYLNPNGNRYIAMENAALKVYKDLIFK
jgi:metal-responsive CopG/Arc/MetJ family transcriptional regulator